MKHIVGFSGGIASAVTAQFVIKEHGEDTILLFHDTKTEPPDNDRFRKEVSEYLGIEITEVSDGRNIWEVFEDEGYFGNGRNTPCSRILKQELALKYIQENMPAVLYIGFTMEEWQRAQRTFMRYKKSGIEVKFPLIENKLSKEDCKQIIENCWKIKIPQMYRHFAHANCIPCIKGGLAYWGLIYKYERDAWEKAAEAEETFKHTIFTEYSLKEKLEHCLKLASEYERKRAVNEDQGDLFDFPCICTI